MEPGDLARVLDINEANVPEVGPVDLDRLGFIVDESAIALVVLDEVVTDEVVTHDTGDGDQGTTIVGFCLVLAPGSAYDSTNYTWFMDRYDDAYYLDRVAFDSAAQGRGLGSALYEEVGRRLAVLGVGLTLEVNVDPPNEPSLVFHAKHGFIEVGRQVSKGIEVSMMARSATA